jgi:hydroxymethylpyrimidine/phosphomethylpyrimidine kinase
MLASPGIVEAVAKAIEANAITKLVVDPVFISKHRDKLLADEAIDALKRRLIPLATLITPNLHEAGGLLGRTIETVDQMKDAARELRALGPNAVLVKGGHLPGDRAVDVYFDGDEVVEIDGPRFDTQDTHGTGCAISAAITARLAHGDELLEAVRFGKRFITGAIEHGLRLGKGYGPVNPGWELFG